LKWNGGPTQTIALLTGIAKNDVPKAVVVVTTDQRGKARPDNGEAKADIGAFESQG
jgi:hypothetical protein